MAITREKIWSAADDLDAAGHSPTLQAVRRAVGGGSYTTIQEAMVEWKARRAAKQVPASEPTPQPIEDAVAELGGHVWAIALQLATERLASEREALEVMRAESDASRQEAADLADQLAAELDEAQGRAAALTEAGVAARAESADLRQRLAVAEARAAEIERQAVAAVQEASNARAEAAAAREAAAATAGRLAGIEEQNTALLAKLTAAKSDK
ncbi:DNA-binding protein [Xanthomonas campestris]|uniref:DNA-binding protein n=1 Tax=Xanthomonas campestris TaxID=339 RepID=UPI002367D438|nr:DNA-binding protein [Xanthomonas campestris]WDJ87447.1 DNA-binding protein [Xanthomonas campestris pv. incanae]WDJ96215.1 DNA-binding protein [Xanthomonas campestris pv. incanae]